ncbi:MAG: membrane protein insertase YidC [Algoriphagus sp.]|jgi:YidC/Oxa1 family membrane protein insertase|uniref:membrane protein insertase YidC n=4 Tax=Algoriphagus TaxID=246875 RepID=UPI000C381701|nr:MULTISPECIES: membrane protein insertase YidC [unclassified Algoriphagus]MAL12652.1 membrane protein insertase YidC [Algoriphagus sp.]
MDKNQATGLILFAAVILIYSIFFASGPEVPMTENEVAVQTVDTASVASPEKTPVLAENDSIVEAGKVAKFGVLAGMTQGSEELVNLENDKVFISISSKGGLIKEVILKEYKNWTQEPLKLLDEESSKMDFSLETNRGPVYLSDFYFTPNVSSQQNEEGETVHILTLSAETSNGKITQKYSITDGSYVVEKSFAIERFSGVFTSNAVQFSWEDQVRAHERDLAESRRKTQVNYYTSAGSYENLGVSDDAEAEAVAEPVKWIGFSQRFFTAGIIADKEFQNVNLNQSTPSDSLFVRNMGANFSLPLENGATSFSYYFGPDQYKTLKRVTDGFEKNVDMGYFFVSWVNKYIIVNLFEFLEKFFDNYGVIIILIVLLIKLALSPLTYKSYIGMAKMRVIKPEIDELKEKYGDDPTKMQQEQMKLFSKLGVSPISGCLPLLLQMPFLFAMFFFFPNAIELRQESFLWAKDLSTYDEFIKLPFTIPFYGSHVSLFTLLMTVSQIVYTHFNNQLTTATGPMKNLGYIMPVMFMFILNSYPAGLSFYYFVSNVVTFGQQALIKLFVDDEKIRQKVEENKVKNANKKKSKFQQKLEEAMKAADSNRKK